jgi:hypothetical protein
LNAVFQVNRPSAENGLPQDRRLRADGFIIRVQAMIRADGCRPRKPVDSLPIACEGLHAALPHWCNRLPVGV